MTQINWKVLEPNPNTNQTWLGLASDTSGSTVFASDLGSPTHIYKTIDVGVDWSVDYSGVTGEGIRNISCQADALKAAAVTPNNLYYNTGSGWAKNTNFNNGVIRSVTLSNTSQGGLGVTQYMWVASLGNEGLFWYSDPTDYSGGGTGVNPHVGGYHYNSVALSDGFYSPQYILVGGYNTGVYKAANNALIWTDITPVAGDQIWTVKMSLDNTLYYAYTSETPSRFYKSTNQGTSWTEKTTGIGDTIQGAHVSTDGQRIILVRQKGAVISMDAGETWSAVTLSFTDHINIAISVTGSSDLAKIFIGTSHGSIYYSEDFGVTWTNLDVVPDTSFPYNWSSVANNYNNSSIIASINDGGTDDSFIYYSNDGGITWHQSRPAGSPSPATPWKDVSMDYAGTVSAAISSPGRVYVSIDSSVTFTEHPVSQSVNKNWQNISHIYNNIFFVSEFGGRLYRVNANSSVYSEVLPAGSVNKDWMFIEFAEDGLHVVAVALNGRAYLSSDTGTTWSEIQPTGNANGAWISCSISSNGKYILVGKEAGRLYLSKDTGVTWAEIQPEGNMNVTWENVFVDDGGETILVSGYYLSGGSPIYIKLYSGDMGVTWESLSSGVGTEQLNKLTANKNGLRILSAGTTTLYQGDVVNFKNASFIGDMII